MSLRRRVIAYVVKASIVLAGPLLAFGQPSTLAQNERTSSSCQGQDIIRFVDSALPLWPKVSQDQSEWRACARVIEPSRPERRFCIAKEYNKKLNGEYAVASGNSLHDQFCKLKERKPDATPEDSVSEASISKHQIESGITLKRLADDLEKLELPLALPNALVMDYPTYELEIHTQYGSTVRVELAGSPLTHPVVKWIKRLESLPINDRKELH